MGGRTMPLECPHGRVIDWGDFGPEDDDGEPEPCPECAADQERLLADLAVAERHVRERRNAETAKRVVQALHDQRWCRCPDDRTMLCGESVAVVRAALD